MSTDAQIAANRANARLSTGPSTPEGKAAASLNAVRHGLFCKQVVLDCEDRAEFEAHCSALLADLAPAGGIEELLAQRAVCESWRLQRVLRIEREMMDGCMAEADNADRAPHDPTLGQAVRPDFVNCAFDRLRVYETRIERAFYKALGELHKLQAARRQSQAAIPLLQARIHAASRQLPALDECSQAALLTLRRAVDADAPSPQLDARQNQARDAILARNALAADLAAWKHQLAQLTPAQSIAPSAPAAADQGDAAGPAGSRPHGEVLPARPSAGRATAPQARTAGATLDSDGNHATTPQPQTLTPEGADRELASFLQNRYSAAAS